MKRSPRRLTLGRETLTRLTPHRLELAAGWEPDTWQISYCLECLPPTWETCDSCGTCTCPSWCEC